MASASVRFWHKAAGCSAITGCNRAAALQVLNSDEDLVVALTFVEFSRPFTLPASTVLAFVNEFEEWHGSWLLPLPPLPQPLPLQVLFANLGVKVHSAVLENHYDV